MKVFVTLVLALLTPVLSVGAASHQPMRPLSTASLRAMGKGPAYFVDAVKGDDGARGTERAPWRSIGFAVKHLKPGDTLYLRGGTYYEAIATSLSGEPNAPIIIRAYPKELAIIDAGYRIFADKPESAWEPAEGGAPNEFVSKEFFPELGDIGGRRGVKVTGNFGDSMVPLHGYHTASDMRTDKIYWALDPNDEEPDQPEESDKEISKKERISKRHKSGDVYCGPGVWYDEGTQKIHIRLGHTNFTALGEANYRGETDPRKMPIVISGARPVLRLEKSRNVHIQDIVFRGTRVETVQLENTDNVELDGITVYGGVPALEIRTSKNLKLTNSAVRGISAPWSFRTSDKYRGSSAYLVMCPSGAKNPSRDIEMAYNEFTDSHDGLTIGGIDNLKFHHNLVENFNDDGLYLTGSGYAGENVQIYQNFIARCLSSFSFAGKGLNQEGKIAFIFRNVIDMRPPTPRHHPFSAEDPNVEATGWPGGEHGGPVWKPLYVYHNTFLVPKKSWRGYYGAGLAVAADRPTQRRIFNNIFWYVADVPGFNFTDSPHDLQADGNLHWSLAEGAKQPPTFMDDNRKPMKKRQEWFEASKKTYSPGWTASDQFADPKFVQIEADWSKPMDLRLQQDSPAINAGAQVPLEWPDVLRAKDKDKPDVGAFPAGVSAWDIGVQGRYTSFGRLKSSQ